MTKFFSNGCCICKLILLYLNSIADLVIQNLSKIINVSYELVQTFWHACKTNYLHLENLLDIHKPHAYTAVNTVSGCLPSFCYYRSEFQAELMPEFECTVSQKLELLPRKIDIDAGATIDNGQLVLYACKLLCYQCENNFNDKI